MSSQSPPGDSSPSGLRTTLASVKKLSSSAVPVLPHCDHLAPHADPVTKEDSHVSSIVQRSQDAITPTKCSGQETEAGVRDFFFSGSPSIEGPTFSGQQCGGLSL